MSNGNKISSSPTKQSIRNNNEQPRTQRQRPVRTANPANTQNDAAEVNVEEKDYVDADGPDGLHHERAHKRRHAAGHIMSQREIFAESDAEADTAAETALGITRKGNTGGGGMNQNSDGFEQGRGQRDAYEQYLRGNIDNDEVRFDKLRKQGTVDSFDPALPPQQVEEKGHFRAASHIVRLYDHWMKDGVDRVDVIRNTANWLCGFNSADNVKKVLQELESKPIRDIYPLEVMLQVLEDMPRALPMTKRTRVIANAEQLGNGEQVFAGHTFKVVMPPDIRIKSFSLLGGARPGYEFYPSPHGDHFDMMIDTPGKWDFAILAAQTKKIGAKLIRETGLQFVDVFSVDVKEMGKKPS